MHLKSKTVDHEYMNYLMDSEKKRVLRKKLPLQSKL